LCNYPLLFEVPLNKNTDKRSTPKCACGKPVNDVEELAVMPGTTWLHSW